MAPWAPDGHRLVLACRVSRFIHNNVILRPALGLAFALTNAIAHTFRASPDIEDERCGQFQRLLLINYYFNLSIN